MVIDISKLSAAERILWDYGITDPADIDLQVIAYGLGATIHVKPLDGCEARLVANKEKAIITVNSKSIPTRQRFSIAHELGHWQLDKGRGGFLCAKDDISPQNDASKEGEALANNFASQLILPDYLFGTIAAAKPISLEAAEKISTVFKASITATSIKMVRKATIPAWIVCHRQRGLAWFFKSQSCPEELYLNRDLHHDTDAFGLLYGPEDARTRYKLEDGTRWFSNREASRYQVRSQSMKLQDGTVLTVLSISK